MVNVKKRTLLPCVPRFVVQMLFSWPGDSEKIVHFCFNFSSSIHFNILNVGIFSPFSHSFFSPPIALLISLHNSLLCKANNNRTHYISCTLLHCYNETIHSPRGWSFSKQTKNKMKEYFAFDNTSIMRTVYYFPPLFHIHDRTRSM